MKSKRPLGRMLYRDKSEDDEFIRKVVQNLGGTKFQSTFQEDQLWLTAYIACSDEIIAQLIPTLDINGWSNVSLSERGFIYPKKRTANRTKEIVAIALEIRQHCLNKDAELIAIDADTHRDVQVSRFVQIYSAPY